MQAGKASLFSCLQHLQQNVYHKGSLKTLFTRFQAALDVKISFSLKLNQQDKSSWQTATNNSSSAPKKSSPVA